MRSRHTKPDLNYWPAVADVFLAAFLLAIFLWFAHNLLSTVKLDEQAGNMGQLRDDNAALRKEIDQLKEQVRIMAQQNESLVAENARLSTENADLKAQLAKALNNKPPPNMAEAQTKITQLQQTLKDLQDRFDLLTKERDTLRFENDELKKKLAAARNDKPPVIDLTDRANFKFDTGKAVITQGFLDAFNRSPDLQRIPEIVMRYDVNLIEIIGHTDGVPASSKESNLDYKLGHVLAESDEAVRTAEIAQLRYGSNADLGLMRAVSVRNLIQAKLGEWRLPNLEIRCYSAAQGVLPTGESKLVGDYTNKDKPDDTRRRIEIRFTRKGDP